MKRKRRLERSAVRWMASQGDFAVEDRWPGVPGPVLLLVSERFYLLPLPENGRENTRLGWHGAGNFQSARWRYGADKSLRRYRC